MKEQLLNNIELELKLLKQLACFIEEKDLSYKPTEQVRTAFELMQYLSTIGSYMMRWIVKSDINDEVRQQVREFRSSLTLQNFPERIDQQWLEIKKYFSEINDSDLNDKMVTLPTKDTMLMGAAIISSVIKWLAVYRMELFLYLKMNGHQQLSTREAWVLAVQEA